MSINDNLQTKKIIIEFLLIFNSIYMYLIVFNIFGKQLKPIFNNKMQ